MAWMTSVTRGPLRDESSRSKTIGNGYILSVVTTLEYIHLKAVHIVVRGVNLVGQKDRDG